MDFYLALAFFLVGFAVAAPCSMVGLGGGILFVPILIVFFHLPPNEAVATSLVAMLGNTVSCSIVYIVHHRVNFKLAFLYDVMDFPGVFLGAWMTTVLSANILMGICGFIILGMGFSLIRRSFQKSEEEGGAGEGEDEVSATTKSIEEHSEFYKNHKHAWIAFALISSFLSGLVSGLAGVGGGMTDTTTMILLGVPPHVAGPTSEFAMAATNVVAVGAHSMLGNVDWSLALPIMLGAVAGAQLGARIMKRVKPIWLLRLLVVFAWVTSVRLILNALGVL
ncbi:MAG: sulfite exporter TauE/SafE family protein [Promethearchaeota archaeon]